MSQRQRVKLFSFEQKGAWARHLLLVVVLIYVGLLLLAPLTTLLFQTFSQGAGAVWRALIHPDVLHSLWFTLWLALGAVVVNTFFGVMVAWVLVRHRFWGRRFFNGIVDLPFAVSPVVAGYMFILLFGKSGWFAGMASWFPFPILFSWPSMLLATIFVSLPFVIREVMPVLEEAGVDQDQAAFTLGASSWQTFWRVTLPSIRWGLIYGITLTLARSLGEFGAVLVVSGAVSGKTETATLFIYRALEERQKIAAYSVALALAAISFLILFMLEYVKKRRQ